MSQIMDASWLAASTRSACTYDAVLLENVDDGVRLPSAIGDVGGYARGLGDEVVGAELVPGSVRGSAGVV